MAFEAGRIMLSRIQNLLLKNDSFAVETTLATKSYKQLVVQAQQLGFRVVLLFFSLQTVALAEARVQLRVAAGGHNIPNEIIERRFKRGLTNLFEIYLPLVNKVLLLDNSYGKLTLIAEQNDLKMTVFNKVNYEHLKTQL